MGIPNEELRSANIRMLKDLQDLERENAELKARLQTAERERPSSNTQREQLERLHEQLAELMDAQAALTRERDTAVASQQKRAHELAAAMEEASQIRKDAVANLDDAHTVFQRELSERGQEAASLREAIAQAESTAKLEAQRNRDLMAQLADATRRAEHAEAELVRHRHSPVLMDACLSPIKSLAEGSQESEAMAKATIATAAAVKESDELRTQVEAMCAAAIETERKWAEREREREQACMARERAADERASAAEAAAGEARENARQLSSQCEMLQTDICLLRRQLAEVCAERRAGSRGTQFQQFVSLKREIASLRASNAALARTDGRAGCAGSAAAAAAAASMVGQLGTLATPAYTTHVAPGSGEPAALGPRPISRQGSASASRAVHRLPGENGPHAQDSEAGTPSLDAGSIAAALASVAANSTPRLAFQRSSASRAFGGGDSHTRGAKVGTGTCAGYSSRPDICGVRLPGMHSRVGSINGGTSFGAVVGRSNKKKS
mmetsp:Transcript_26821/g.75107  ORF Transcript_26821/g.75107 Transcript_26821/m.75107 type:complete len:498 (+) Transcript_26821:146-1639(+)